MRNKIFDEFVEFYNKEEWYPIESNPQYEASRWEVILADDREAHFMSGNSIWEENLLLPFVRKYHYGIGCGHIRRVHIQVSDTNAKFATLYVVGRDADSRTWANTHCATFREIAYIRRDGSGNLWDRQFNPELKDNRIKSEGLFELFCKWFPNENYE